MVASRNSVEQIVDIIAKYVPKKQFKDLAHDLATVTGNASVTATMDLVANELLKRQRSS